MTSTTFEFELPPEAVALLKLQSELDRQDAGPTLPVDSFVYKGVCISSRYSSISEFNHMKHALDSLPEILMRRILSVWCDSKAGNVYSFVLQDLASTGVIDAIRLAFKGNNGITIDFEEGSNNPKSISFDPDWVEPVEFG